MVADVPSVSTDGGNQHQNSWMRTFQVVVAATRSLGIGKNGKLPWRLPSDMKFFKELTMSTSDPTKTNAVIMGRKTWESIPSEYRPLPGRLNVVLTRLRSSDIATVENVLISGSMDSALHVLAAPPYCSSIERVFVIGGGQVLRDFLNGPGCDAIHLTNIEREFECDTFLPPIDHSLFRLWYSSSPLVDNNIRYSFESYVCVRPSTSTIQSVGLQDIEFGNKNEVGESDASRFSFLPKIIFERHEEFNYLKFVREILANSAPNDDRNGTGKLVKFGCQLHFNLRKSFPLLTTKNISWQRIVEELLQFISGSRDAKEKGIHIWDDYASRAFLACVGWRDRPEGELGPISGFDWRQFASKYTDVYADCSDKGFDQLLDVIEKIKKIKDNQQIIFSVWNRMDTKVMPVPPCCIYVQFHAANGELSCHFYQSSGDIDIEIPVNIASYSLLTCIIAHICDLQLGDFVHVLGDAYVYKTSVKSIEEQLQNQIGLFPVLRINSDKKDINSFVADDFELFGYDLQQH